MTENTGGVIARKAANPISREVIVAAIMVAWGLVIAFAMYDFKAPTAIAQFTNATQYWGAIFTQLPRNIQYLPPVLLFLASAFGPGDLLVGLLKLPLKYRRSRIIFAICFGIIAWTIAIVIVGMAGFLTKPPLYSLLLIALGLTVWRGWLLFKSNGAPEKPVDVFGKTVAGRALTIGLIVLLVFDLYMALLGALGPETGFDARYYHLAMALRYAIHGKLFDLVADTYSASFGVSQYQETLYAAMIAMFGLHAAKLLNWANLLLTIAAISAFAVEFYGSRLLGLLASLLFVSTPIVTFSASTASNDLGQAPFTVLALFSFLKWKDDRRLAWLAAAGACCGYTYGMKPLAAIVLVILGLFVLVISLSRRLVRPDGDPARNARDGWKDAMRTLVPFALGAFVVALPSVIRTTLMTGDPVFPELTSVFHSLRDWSPWMRVWTAGYPTRSIADAVTLPWNMTFDTITYRQVVGPVFLFAAPFVLWGALQRGANPLLRQSVGLIALWAAFWYGFGITSARYGESIFPFAFLMVAYFCLPIAQGTRSILSRPIVRTTFLAIILCATVLNTQLLVPFQKNADYSGTMGHETIMWPILYGTMAESAVTSRYTPMLEYVNQHLNPQTDKVLDAADNFPMNLYSNIDIFDGMNWEGPEWNILSPDAYKHVQEEHITYVIAFKRDLPQLSKAPLFAHLQFVTSTAPSPRYPVSDPTTAGKADLLYKVL